MPNVCVLSINVPDMELAKQFYCKKLGFELAEQYDEKTIQLQHDGIYIILSKAERATSVDYPAEAQVVPGIATDDIVKTVTAYKSLGIEFIYDAPLPSPAGLYTAFKDPFGNVFELLEFSE